MPSPAPPIHHLSTCTVKPPPLPPKRCHLTPWDLAMFSVHYIQKGLLFANLPPSLSTHQIIDRLKSSLSTALLHFYPLAGRFVTEEAHDDEHQKLSGIFWSIDCNGEGAEFIHAVADKITVSDVLSPSDDVPSFIRSFFPLDGAINHDGHTQPLLAVQLTELADGIFIGCSFNHAVGDGTSYWNFFNAWAEIARTKGVAPLSRPPVHDRWFVDGYDTAPIKLPFTHPDDFMETFSPPPLREKIFHFSVQSVAQLKAKANQECGTSSISSFQALSAVLHEAQTLLEDDGRDEAFFFGLDLGCGWIGDDGEEYAGGEEGRHGDLGEESREEVGSCSGWVRAGLRPGQRSARARPESKTGLNI